MNGLAMVAVALLFAMAGSRLVLHGARVQTSLGRILGVWAAVWAAALYPVSRYGGIGIVTLTIFWAGAFLSWFGVLSHIESSILLRMVYLLRRQPMTEAQVVETYSSQCRPGMRVEDLLRGGLATQNAGVLTVTGKGKAILRLAERLR
jgi:hypothetical protein